MCTVFQRNASAHLVVVQVHGLHGRRIAIFAAEPFVSGRIALRPLGSEPLRQQRVPVRVPVSVSMAITFTLATECGLAGLVRGFVDVVGVLDPETAEVGEQRCFARGHFLRLEAELFDRAEIGGQRADFFGHAPDFVRRETEPGHRCVVPPEQHR
jgi:hypothetical protein